MLPAAPACSSTTGDAVDEFAAARNIRVYSTMESYLPSFYFLKCGS